MDAFKVKYGLAKSSDPEFGFDTGYVPEFPSNFGGPIA
jgi:hypothetical protein